jgi:exopolysaccharide biosynthesis polyprenyl glycosylphosphotransferase
MAVTDSHLRMLDPGPSRPAPGLADVLGVLPGASHRPGARETNLKWLLLVADAVALAIALLLVQLGIGLQRRGPDMLVHDLALLLVALPSWVVVSRARDHYRLPSRRAHHGATEDLVAALWTSMVWSWGVLLLAPLLRVPTPPVPKLAAFGVVTLLLVTALRAAARAWACRRPWYRQSTIVVAPIEEAARPVPKLLRHPEYGIDVVATVAMPGLGVDPRETLLRRLPEPVVPIIRGDVDLLEVIGELGVQRVIFGPSLHQLPGYQELLSGLRERHVHVDLVPGWSDVVGTQARVHELEGMALVTVPTDGLSRPALMAKRALDVTAALGALFVVSPLLLVIAAAIKLDSPGPVFFRQRRVGRGDRRFQVVKFRTMREDAEQRKRELAHLSLHGGGTANGMFKIAEDPRVTRVGRILRRHSLDELPQLFNVLLGDMSLVGPRPLIENEDRQVGGRHRRRISLTPGLTGLWQVNGRSDIPFEGMIDLDYVYVTNWSLGADLKILLRTVGTVLRGRGAY